MPDYRQYSDHFVRQTGAGFGAATASLAAAWFAGAPARAAHAAEDARRYDALWARAATDPVFRVKLQKEAKYQRGMWVFLASMAALVTTFCISIAAFNQDPPTRTTPTGSSVAHHSAIAHKHHLEGAR